MTKLDQDTKKSFCLLRFEINGTSPAEDVENFAMFSVHRVFYTSAPSGADLGVVRSNPLN